MSPDLNTERSIFIRWLVGVSWFIAIYIIIIFGLAEAANLYANMNFTGEDAIKIDKELSFTLGSYFGAPLFFISGIVVARLSVKGRLPGTSKYKNKT